MPSRTRNGQIRNTEPAPTAEAVRIRRCKGVRSKGMGKSVGHPASSSLRGAGAARTALHEHRPPRAESTCHAIDKHIRGAQASRVAWVEVQWETAAVPDARTGAMGMLAFP